MYDEYNIYCHKANIKLKAYNLIFFFNLNIFYANMLKISFIINAYL